MFQGVYFVNVRIDYSFYRNFFIYCYVINRFSFGLNDNYKYICFLKENIFDDNNLSSILQKN